MILKNMAEAANALDQIGLSKEANYLDKLIRKTASIELSKDEFTNRLSKIIFKYPSNLNP